MGHTPCQPSTVNNGGSVAGSIGIARSAARSRSVARSDIDAHHGRRYSQRHRIDGPHDGRHGRWHEDREGCPQTLSEKGSLSGRDIEG